LARTLPHRYPLRRREDGVLEALIVDPCCWSPALPACYQLYAREAGGDGDGREYRRVVGFRRMQPFRQSLRLEGTRWVLRGVHRRLADPAELSGWHALSTVLVTGQPNEELCDRADREGVMVVAREECSGRRTTGSATEQRVARLQQLADHPSLAMVLVEDPAAALGPELRRGTPHLLVAAIYDPTRDQPPPEWAHVLVCEADRLVEASPEQASRISIPMIARRMLSKEPDLPVARAACDRLQRELAPRYDLAGYIV
jgi:hypothetical protein